MTDRNPSPARPVAGRPAGRRRIHPNTLLLAVLALAGWAPPSFGGGGGENLLLVVNPGDEHALRIANAYARARAIPESHIVFIEPRVTQGHYRGTEPETKDSFHYVDYYLAPVLAHLTNMGLEGQIDYIAGLGQPFKMGIATEDPRQAAHSGGFTYVHLDALTAGTNAEALAGYWRMTPIYQDANTYTLGHNGAIHHDGAGLYMGGAVAFTGLFGNDTDRAITNLLRTAAADGARPQGKIYFEKNDDIRSTTREYQWPTTQAALNARGIPWLVETNVSGSTPLNRDDVRGAVIGRANHTLPNGSTYLAGSWADNLTSNGMQYDTRSQTKATGLLAAGAGGTGGTVREPYAVWQRFPHSHVHVYSADGSTLGEAFYKSVYAPDLQWFVGDMLAQPYADMPAVGFDAGTPADGATVSDTVPIGATASLESPTLATAITRIDLYVDGRPAATSAGSSAAFDLDTTTLSDGRHEIRVVAVNNAAAESENFALRHWRVDNDGRQAAVTGGDRTVGPTEVAAVALTAAAGHGALDRIELRYLGRALGQTAVSGGSVNLDATKLAFGGNELFPVAVFAGGQEVRGDPVIVTREKPWMAGRTPLTIYERTPGIKGEYFVGAAGASIAASDFSGAPDLEAVHSRVFLAVNDTSKSQLDEDGTMNDVEPLAIQEVDGLAVRLSGRFTAAAGEYTFFSYKSNDSLRLSIDGTPVLGFDNASSGFTTLYGASVFLEAGEHDIEVLAANRATSGTDYFFDIGIYYRGPDGVTRIVDDSLVYQYSPAGPNAVFWAGAGDNDGSGTDQSDGSSWSIGDNWHTGAVPGATHDVIIDSRPGPPTFNLPLTLDGNVTVNTLTIRGDFGVATADLGDAGSPAGSLTVAGGQVAYDALNATTSQRAVRVQANIALQADTTFRFSSGDGAGTEQCTLSGVISGGVKVTFENPETTSIARAFRITKSGNSWTGGTRINGAFEVYGGANLGAAASAVETATLRDTLIQLTTSSGTRPNDVILGTGGKTTLRKEHLLHSTGNGKSGEWTLSGDISGGGASAPLCLTSAANDGIDAATGQLGGGTNSVRLTGSLTFAGPLELDTLVTLDGTMAHGNIHILPDRSPLDNGANGGFTGSRLTGSGTVHFNIDGTSSDRIEADGELDIGALTIDFDLGPGGATAAAYVIADYADGTLAGAAFAATVDVPAGYRVEYGYAGGTQIALVRSTDPAAIDVNPASHDFGAVPVGGTRSRDFVVENTGGQPLDGTASVGSPFAIVSGGAYSLGPGQTGIVRVVYAPAAAGRHTNDVTFTGATGAVRTVTGRAIAQGDTDGDGSSDWDEEIAGTSPNDRTDYFRILSIEAGAGANPRISWRSVTGRTYRVYASTNLLDWTQMNETTGDGTLKTYSYDGFAGDRLFLRVEAVKND